MRIEYESHIARRNMSDQQSLGQPQTKVGTIMSCRADCGLRPNVGNASASVNPRVRFPPPQTDSNGEQETSSNFTVLRNEVARETPATDCLHQAHWRGAVHRDPAPFGEVPGRSESTPGRNDTTGHRGILHRRRFLVARSHVSTLKKVACAVGEVRAINTRFISFVESWE